MNILDLVVLAAMAVAGYFGYRLGFVARVTSWLGLALGIVLAAALVGGLLTLLRHQPSQTRFFGVIAFFLFLGTVGQASGFAAGHALRRRLPGGAALHQGDRVGGAAVGVLGVLVALWLLIPALASTQGWPARAARGSGIVRALDRWAPDPPPQAQRLGRRVAQYPFPEVFAPLTGPPDVGRPPQAVLAPAVSSRVERSVVKIEGQACDQIQAGTGWAASAGLVVTNAHVVAGERRTSVETDDGRRLSAQVVVFDAERDVAVLRVRNLDLTPLPRAGASDGETGAVFGHPGGGPLRVAPARIARTVDATGTDIYRTRRTDRSVYVLAAKLAPGDSGGALVDTRGRVVGVAFAVDPGQQSTAYALTGSEVTSVLDPVLTGRTGLSGVSTGPCLAG